MRHNLSKYAIDYGGTLVQYLESAYLRGESRELLASEFITSETRDPRPGFGHANFSFKGHEYQEAILNDMSQNMCSRKCSQVGLSEAFLRRSLVQAFLYQLSVGYVMPTKTHLSTYVPKRIDPIIANSPKLSEGLSRKGDNKQMKMFNSGGCLYLLHSWTKSEGFATQMDSIVADEYDRLNPEFVEQLPSRLGHSEYSLQAKLCTPTNPEIGIDAEFERSDQKFWLIRCPCCNLWQKMGFESIMFEKTTSHLPTFHLDMPERSGLGKEDLMQKYFDCLPYVGCINPSCRRELNRYDHTLREWVAEYPSREYSGWDINRFHVPRLNSLGEPCSRHERGVGHDAYTIMVNFFESRRIKEFVNQVLGMAYSTGDESISEQDIKNALAAPEDHLPYFLEDCSGPCFMGIDQKSVLNFVIVRVLNKKVYLVHASEFRMIRSGEGGGLRAALDYTVSLIRRFRVRFFSVEAMPDLNFPSALVNIFPDRGITTWVGTPNAPHTMPTKASRQVTVNRTWIVDEVVGMIKGFGVYELRFPQFMLVHPVGLEVSSHLRSLVRTEVEDDKDGILIKTPVWKTKSGKTNDYMFALSGSVLAFIVWSKDPTKSLSTGVGLLDLQVVRSKALFNRRASS